MNRLWVLVVIAAVFEVVWVSGFKYAGDWLTWSMTAIGIIVSSIALFKPVKALPASTVYSVFVGLGTAGTVIIEMVLFNAAFHWLKILFIMTLLVGIIGLKTITDDKTSMDKEHESWRGSH